MAQHDTNIGRTEGQRRTNYAQGTTSVATRRLLWIGVVLGIGVAGTLDEVVFHQLLQWHNFYVHTTAYWRIVSDGLFHLFSSLMLIAGSLLLWHSRQLLSTLSRAQALSAGMLMGAGAFNFYDGMIQHKILQLHPVREGVTNLLPYDLAWNAVALVVFGIGWVMWRGLRERVSA
jgi:uncharacterized membrane protein